MSINNEDKSGYANVEIKPMLLENPYADLGLNRIKDKNANNTKDLELVKIHNAVTKPIEQKTALKLNNSEKLPAPISSVMPDKNSLSKPITVNEKKPVNTKNDSRRLIINQAEKNKKKYNFPNNFVSTSKYTLLTFLPHSLLLQFTRYANIYFLVIAVLQSIPRISPMNPSTAIAPLIFVLMISMVREGFEDYERHVSDERENEDKVLRYKDNSFQEDFSKNIEVGDIIKVVEYNIIPADFLLLSCDNLSKIAYIETANLDGEKNLKPRFCFPNVYNIFKDASSNCLRIRGKILCDKPNSDLNKFNGRLKLSIKNELSVGIKQFLYKGIL
jgi:magnesium-transporting ATPase (P-type)